jgi:hypothetical protein
MRHLAVLLIVPVILLAGCEYKAPLTKEHSMRIDAAVLGEWESVPDAEETSADQNGMVILRYSDTEYLIHYPTDKHGIYYRGYPMRIGSIACVQLEALGAEDGPFEKNEDELFHVAKYEIEKGILEIKMLNTDLIDTDLTDSDALRKAFLKNKDNTDLFNDPGRFKRES